jgi:hypothetical protein
MGESEGHEGVAGEDKGETEQDGGAPEVEGPMANHSGQSTRRQGGAWAVRECDNKSSPSLATMGERSIEGRKGEHVVLSVIKSVPHFPSLSNQRPRRVKTPFQVGVVPHVWNTKEDSANGGRGVRGKYKVQFTFYDLLRDPQDPGVPLVFLGPLESA